MQTQKHTQGLAEEAETVKKLNERRKDIVDINTLLTYDEHPHRAEIDLLRGRHFIFILHHPIYDRWISGLRVVYQGCLTFKADVLPGQSLVAD